MVTGEEEKKHGMAAEIMRKKGVNQIVQVWLQTIVGTHLINVPVKYSDS